MNNNRNPWLIFGIGVLFIFVEWVFPDIVREYTLEIPLPGGSMITIVGTFGYTLAILSIIKILDYIPSWDRILSKDKFEHPQK